MRKILYKKRLLLISIYSIFIFYTFYVILKTSSKFGNSNKNITEDNIIDAGAIDISDLNDSKNINGENDALNLDLYDENDKIDNINNADIDNNILNGNKNTGSDNNTDDDSNIVEGDNNMEEADKIKNEDDNNNLDSDNNESDNNENESDENNEGENNIDNDNNIDIDNNMDSDNNIDNDNDNTLEHGDNNGDEEDIERIKEQLSNENNENNDDNDNNAVEEEQYNDENDGDNNDNNNDNDNNENNEDENENNENGNENENENENENGNTTGNKVENKQGSNKTFKKYSSDLGYVLNYDGGEIEPEWDWIRNISIVYTWVDGSDVNFADEKAKYNGGFRDSTSRDRSADELKYSIRSVEKYLPWHNGTIYILTHSQIPKWLDTTNPRIKMVYHKDIFPEHVYPTYDSATIEAFLDKIPGVTERFIYFNDDVFLNKYVHPCFFFTRENFYPQIYRRFPVTLEESEINKIIAENNIHMIFTASKYYTRKLAREYFDDKFEYYDLLHTPHVYYRDLMEPFRQLFHEEFKEIFSNRFRNGRKFVTQYLFQVFMQYATQHPEFPLKLGGNGKARNFVGKPLPDYATIKNYSVRIVSGKVGDYLVKFGKITDSSRSNKRYFDYIKNHKALLVYNFNDAYTNEIALHEFTSFMISQYPEASSFEKKEFVELEAPFAKKIVQINDFLEELIIDLKHTFPLEDLNSMKNMIIRHRINVTRDYINRKNFFVQEGKRISDREDEEIRVLSTYKGDALTEEWAWAKQLSLVYIVDNNENDLQHDKIMELKYSLRSVEKYLPWFDGKIYLISQNDRNAGFEWVNKNHKNIKVIYYRDIIPAKYYPTINKHVIEMYLDNIPELSEKFVFLENHHFFKRYTHPHFFFSKEFYPKYNFKDVIPVDKHIMNVHSVSSFLYTSKAIVRYFGDSYVNSFRHLENAPYAFYRDLFKPTRELFWSQVEKTNLHKDYGRMDLLPIYLVANYNIYATAQPFYPEYVAGYGYVRNFPPPKLNPMRTVKYYGFDITSPFIADNTICTKTLSDNYSDNLFMLQEIEQTMANFFSLTLDKLKNVNEAEIMAFLQKLYEDNSSYEN